MSSSIAQETVPFEIERSVVLKREPGTTDGSYWMHPRAAVFPDKDANGKEHLSALMVVFKFLGRSDFYSGLSTMRSEDAGKTWSPPVLEKNLDWIQEGDVNIAVADVTPGFHAPSGKVIAIGAQVRYSPKGKQLEDQPKAHQTAYAVFDPESDTWTQWQRLDVPDEPQFNFARSACGQWLTEDDGTILFPLYIGEGTHKPFATTIARYRFDGKKLEFIEHGNILELDVKRGLYEPSIVKFEGRYFLTMRNDLHAYVSVSDDGIHYTKQKKWTLDGEEDLGSYNTQAHWVTLGKGLFLVYTRRGLNNDHVMRHRSPLVMAQVDPEKLVVLRATEKILVPEKGATLGNSGITVIDENESWITVSEANVDLPPAKERGADGSLYLVKVKTAAL